jgi:hypothetical protein
MYGLGDLTSQVQALTDAGVDPTTAYNLAVSSMGTSESSATPSAAGAGVTSSPITQLASYFGVGSGTVTNWLMIGGAVLLGVVVLRAMGGGRWR